MAKKKAKKVSKPKKRNSFGDNAVAKFLKKHNATLPHGYEMKVHIVKKKK